LLRKQANRNLRTTAMNKDEILEYVTDKLCGELSTERQADIDRFLRECPDSADEAHLLDQVWRDLELVDVAPPEPELLDRIGRTVMERISDCELSDEELDLAAGGVAPPLTAPEASNGFKKDEP
jgi:hypothetical protein